MTKEEKKTIISYAKSELGNYNTLKAKRIHKNFKALDLETRIDKISSGSPSTIPQSTASNDNWRTPLWEELEQVEREMASLDVRIEKIDKFIKRLQPQDREIIYNLHIAENRKKTYREYCYDLNMAKNTLQRYVDSLILDKWYKVK